MRNILLAVEGLCMRKNTRVKLTASDMALLICDERNITKEFTHRNVHIGIVPFTPDDIDDLETIRDALDKEIEALNAELDGVEEDDDRT
jgi:hypothetical protein